MILSGHGGVRPAEGPARMIGNDLKSGLSLSSRPRPAPLVLQTWITVGSCQGCRKGTASDWGLKQLNSRGGLPEKVHGAPSALKYDGMRVISPSSLTVPCDIASYVEVCLASTHDRVIDGTNRWRLFHSPCYLRH